MTSPDLSTHSSEPEANYVAPPPLALETVADAIGSSFPDVDTVAIRHIGSGSLFDAFLTTDGWVFRFPRWDWCESLFEPEANIHRFVANVLPARIGLPRVQLLGQPTARFPYRFAGHRYIPGVAADDVHEALVPTLTREIATFLGTLHSTPAAEAEKAGFREITVNEAGRREWFVHYVRVSARLRGIDSIIDHAVDWLSTISPDARPFQYPRQLIHCGLSPDHILVDPATGIISGVIDWTDGSVGDAAGDFIFLVTWRGWRFAEEVLRLYPRTVDDGFRTRLRYYARWLSVMWLAYAYEQGNDLTKDIAGVHHAFAK